MPNHFKLSFSAGKTSNNTLIINSIYVKKLTSKMQSLRLLQELNSNGAGAAVTKRMIDGEEGFPINVQVFPSTSAKSHQMPAGEENLAQEKEEERMEVLYNGKMEEMPKVGEPMEVGIAACDFDAKMEEEEEPEEEDEVREEWEEEEEEEDEPLSERRRMNH